MKYRFQNTFFIIIALFLAGCRKEDKGPENVLKPVNQWILDSMRTYYYWSSQIPAAPADQADANAFFNSLLASADRFSYIENISQSDVEYSSYSWYGFEYALVNVQGGMLGVITLVVPDGPAQKQTKLERGLGFTEVNGVALNAGTLESVKKILREGKGVTLKTVRIEGGILKENGDMRVVYEGFMEQPVYMTRVFANGNKKAGYIFYNAFKGRFDRRMLDSLNKLKSAGVTEWIIDVRYNPGGDVASAAKIAAVFTRVTADEVFSIYEANSHGGRFVNSFQKTMNENNYQPNAFEEVVSGRVAPDKVVVLTSGATASAAELLVNNLRPYVQVIQIGGVTMGKDMGGFPVYGQGNAVSESYILHPLVFKLFNAKGVGNYAGGLTPDYAVDELQALPLKAFGDPEDPLLKKALELTVGLPVVVGGRKAAAMAVKTEQLVFSSARTRSSAFYPELKK